MTALCRDIMNNIYKMYVSTGLLVMFSVQFWFYGLGGGGVILFTDVQSECIFIYTKKSRMF